MADESKQKTVRVVNKIELHVARKNKLVIRTSDLVFDEEGKLIEVKPVQVPSELDLPIDLKFGGNF